MGQRCYKGFIATLPEMAIIYITVIYTRFSLLDISTVVLIMASYPVSPKMDL